MLNLAFPVSIVTRKYQQLPHTKIYYPQVENINNHHIAQQINQQICQMVRFLYDNQFIKQDHTAFAQMIGTYELKMNERHILSLTYSNYAIANQAANGLTLMDAQTFNTQTGEIYMFKDLFLPDSHYAEALTTLIKKQIQTRDIPTIAPLPEIGPYQSFYLSDKCLILFFPALAFTPHYVGIPVFPISIFSLESMINPDGPLAKMLPTIG